MGRKAKEGPSFEALVKMAIPLLKEAERRCPRKGPGAKPVIADWVIAALIMIAILARAKSRQRRAERRKYLENPLGRRLYGRRKKTVEPFNQWLKALFELDHRVRHRGLENNQTQFLASIFAYQLLTRHNYRHGNKNGQLHWILDTL